MKEEVLVSIIVPVYNVECFIKRCIDSLINQTYRNIEIILIDDGSTDACPRICDEYGARDERIAVFHKSNGGLSDARNYGLNKCNGTYVMFVDSDDYVEVNAVKNLLKIMVENNLDVLEYNALKEDINQKKPLIEANFMENEILTGKDYLLNLVANDHINAPAWLKFVKLSLIKDNELYFKEQRIHEDELWTPQLFLCASRVMYVNETYYHYCVRSDSITQKRAKEKNIIAYVENCFELEKKYDECNTINEKERRILKDNLVRQMMAASVFASDNINFYKQAIDKKFIIRNAYMWKTRIKSCVFLMSLRFYIYLRERRS